MAPITAVIGVASGATTIDIPNSFPSIFKLYSVRVIEIADNSGTIAITDSEADVGSYTDREITLSTATSGSGIAVVVYEPELTLTNMI